VEKFRILIVDDEEDLREIFRDGLEAQGFEVFEATSGNQAIQFIKNQSVHGVISDIRMPDGSGLDFLEYLQNINAEEMTVFLMTGFSDITPEEAYDRGAAALFRKPVDPDIVIQSIKQIQKLKKRQHIIRPPRYDVKFPIEISFPNRKPILGKTSNLSRGGLLCYFPNGSCKEGESFQFTIQYRTDHPDQITGSAIVRRFLAPDKIHPIARIAAEFKDLDPASKTKLKDLLQVLDEKVIPVH